MEWKELQNPSGMQQVTAPTETPRMSHYLHAEDVERFSNPATLVDVGSLNARAPAWYEITNQGPSGVEPAQLAHEWKTVAFAGVSAGEIANAVELEDPLEMAALARGVTVRL